jgi:hypothetical protein
LEKHSVKVALTGWKTARPRSRAPASCLASCATRCALRRLGVRAGLLPTASRHGSSVPFAPATSEREPSPRSASRAVRPPRTTQRSLARPPAERTYRGPSPYCGVTVSSCFDAQAMEPAGYKSHPLSHAQADVVVRHWRLHGELALLLFPAAVWHPSRLN